MLYLLVNVFNNSYSKKLYLLENVKKTPTFVSLCVSYRRAHVVSQTGSPSTLRWKAEQVEMKAVFSYDTCKKNAFRLSSPMLEGQS